VAQAKGSPLYIVCEEEEQYEFFRDQAISSKTGSVERIRRLDYKSRAGAKSTAGCTNIKYIKRFYILDTIPGPPRELTKIVKCVKYFSYWEFTDKDALPQRTIGFSSGIPSK